MSSISESGKVSVSSPARGLHHLWAFGSLEGRIMADDERAFSFLRVNQRPPKPRSVGLTEIRGPYYTPLGPRYLQDVLETYGGAVDIFKFGGGSFALLPRRALRELIELCHRHQVRV